MSANLRPRTVANGITCMGELLDDIGVGPYPAEELQALRHAAMRLTCLVLHRFPEPGITESGNTAGDPYYEAESAYDALG